MNNPYTEILQTLAEAGVDFIIAGGVACVLHGVERVTMDVDLSILMTPANLRKFIHVMNELGLKPRVPIAPKSLMDPETIRMMIEEKGALVFSFLDPDRPIHHVDIFLRQDHSYESFLPDSEWMELRGFGVRVLSKPRLLEIKRAIVPPRAKDALDIEFLSRHDPVQ